MVITWRKEQLTTPDEDYRVFAVDSGSDIAENGVPAGQSPGVTLLRQEDDRMVYAIESGAYWFESRYFR